LTARGYTRVLKVARTIADLDGADTVRRVHIAEALSYRHRPAGEGSTALPGRTALAR
jgi:magnesium chelatase family protein